MSGSIRFVRFDKADLGNQTLMTTSGTTPGGLGIFSDGTFIYDCYFNGSVNVVKKYSISGTTITS